MTSAVDLLRQGRVEDLWRNYCGFVDLSLDEFMYIQKRLLLEQLQFLRDMPLARKIMGDAAPATVEEFRQTVPLTTYRDYTPYLLEKDDSMLLEAPAAWVRTSGRSGEYGCKWVPYSSQMYTHANRQAFAGLILAAATKHGEVLLEEDDIIFNTLAPEPYISGAVYTRGLLTQFPFRFIPPLDESAKMEFGERIQTGFKLAMRSGVDIIYGLASILVRVGEQFSSGGRSFGFSSFYMHPAVLSRLSRGMLRARLFGRRMLPKDIWHPKAIGVGGMDVSIFRDKIYEYWGKQPNEGYAGSEIMVVACQLWNHKGMTFYPDANFLEFIPEDEHIRGKRDPNYGPQTVLLDEVQTGQRYELVVTNFHGGVFVRYRPGDLIEIIARRDEEVEVDIPQMVFHSRADEIVDIAGFTRLTEKTIWKAIQATDVAYSDWTARKEVEGGKPVLRVYIELKHDEHLDELRAAIHGNLTKLDNDYRDLGRLLDLDPLRLTRLSPGTFDRYYGMKKQAGAELAHMKPPHVNPSLENVHQLLQASEQG
ncbi:MAG: GH3 auxin-responsive promoter family protein [Anaerolineales bacterium]|nr:MAG: GH3 auxin-responsive promoter family protein [Anaerolineales bacterium]